MIPTTFDHFGLCQMKEARRVVMATELKDTRSIANPVS